MHTFVPWVFSVTNQSPETAEVTYLKVNLGHPRTPHCAPPGSPRGLGQTPSLTYNMSGCMQGFIMQTGKVGRGARDHLTKCRATGTLPKLECCP